LDRLLLSDDVIEEKRVLLNNALDALDRLFDRETDLMDVEAIFCATGVAIRPDPLSLFFLEASLTLGKIRREGLTSEDVWESALRSTNELRIALAEVLQE